MTSSIKVLAPFFVFALATAQSTIPPSATTYPPVLDGVNPNPLVTESLGARSSYVNSLTEGAEYKSRMTDLPEVITQAIEDLPGLFAENQASAFDWDELPSDQQSYMYSIWSEEWKALSSDLPSSFSDYVFPTAVPVQTTESESAEATSDETASQAAATETSENRAPKATGVSIGLAVAGAVAAGVGMAAL